MNGSAKLLLLLCCCLSLSVRSLNVLASEPTDANGVEHFEQHIRPLLVSHCLKCHGPDEPKNDLRLDSLDAILTGGESGPAIELDNPQESLLLSALHYDALEMPPAGKLANKEISAVEKWLELGTPWPTDVTLSVAESSPREITEADRKHWSFQSIAKPDVPSIEAIEYADWSRTPIDQFILRSLLTKGLNPAPQADRRTLIRRVYFDLLGVPPSPRELQSFLLDESDDAYERLVDELLARPEYGERWARLWLDLVRYAESDGFRQDAYRKGAYHYRDYVIRSLNEDKPYDRFVAEQLAGDELYPDDPAAWVGTAYFRLQPYEYNQRDIVTQRQDLLNDITDVTADVFLGLGMKCARCHDHKFDPILQKDYFRLQAHFAALMPRDDVPLLSPPDREHYEQQLAEWQTATQQIHDQIDEIWRPYLEKQAAAAIAKFTPELQGTFEKPDDQRAPLEKQLAYFIARQTREEGKPKLKEKDAKRVKDLEAELKRFGSLKPKTPAMASVSNDVGAKAPFTFVSLKRRSEGDAIEPDGMQVLNGAVPKVNANQLSNSTGRRTALVRWLTSPEHPLTARVAVNRIWQQHFGRGLVPTPSDFGKLGSEPSHPELLDWLATTFMKQGWQSKDIHRMILNSSTYKQSARHPSATEQETIDPENQYCWRSRVRRLDAEQLIDATLSVSGQLVERVGGPGESSSTKRRAIYRKVMRNKPDPLLSLFDGADNINSTPRRNTTTTSPQALSLLNGKFGIAAADAMAKRIARSTKEARSQIQLGYELAFGRSPSETELQLAIEYLEDSNQTNRLSSFCHVLLNANEFIYVD